MMRGTRHIQRRLVCVLFCGCVMAVFPPRAAAAQKAAPPVPSTSAAAADSPRIEVDSPTVELGAGLFNKPMSHSFRIKNVGKAPLLLSGLHASCGCTTGAIPSDPIAPGSTESVEVRYRAESGKERVGLHSFTATIETNDPLQRTLDLTIKAHLVKPVEVEPDTLDLSPDPSGVIKERYVEVKCYKDVTLPKVTGVAASEPLLKVALVSETPTEFGSTSRYSVQIAGEHSPRALAGTISFSTSESSLPVLEVPVKLSTPIEVTAVPAQFLFGIVDAGSNKTVTASLTWKAGSPAPAFATCTDPRIQCQLAGGGNPATLSVTFSADTQVSQAQKVKTSIQVLDEQKVKLLDLPVLAVVTAKKTASSSLGVTK